MSYNVVMGSPVISMKAGEALAANRIVKLHSTAGQVIYPTGAGDTPFGVTLEAAASGTSVPVALGGVVKIRTANAVALAARVHLSGTAGDIDDNLDGQVNTKYVGIAMEASGEAGVEIPVALNLPGVAEDGGAA